MGYVEFYQDDKGYMHTDSETGKQDYLPVIFCKKMLK